MFNVCVGEVVPIPILLDVELTYKTPERLTSFVPATFATSNLLLGAVVPIPTYPFESERKIVNVF